MLDDVARKTLADMVRAANLLVFSVMLGKGKRLFADGSELTLTLTETLSFDSGVALLQYEQTASS